MIDTSQLPEQVRAGRFPAGIYSDPDVHTAERQRLFSRTWQFLAHESEIPQPGDFVVRRMLDDSFIVARDDTGAVRVLLNQCRHRGMQVCRAEAGQATFFRCPYHAWTYRNTGELVGVPFHVEAYGGLAAAGGVLQRIDLCQSRPSRYRPGEVARRHALLPGFLHASKPRRRRAVRPAALASAVQLEDRCRKFRW
jgi:nitrite reductase/ring-hydroxylating ferredoxin subunit